MNVGCIPSKALLDSSHRFYEAAGHLDTHGIKIEKVKLSILSGAVIGAVTGAGTAGGISGLFKANKVTPILGEARVLNSTQVEVSFDGKSQVVSTKHIIIATGSSPIDISAAPIDQENIVDSTGALTFDSVPKKLVIIGAGVIGLELGSVWARLGSEVTVLEAMDEFLPLADKRIARDVLRELKKQGLNINLGCKVTTAQSNSKGVKINFENNEEVHKLQVDKLIVAVGRKPNTSSLIDEKCGITFDERGFIPVNNFCETSIKNIWAVGDVVRGPMLAHKASEEGIMVVERIAGKHAEIKYDLIPSVIYTHPEVAWVGKNEEELSEAGVDFKTGTFPFAASGRALAVDQSIGFVKLLADAKTDTNTRRSCLRAICCRYCSARCCCYGVWCKR